MSWNKNITLLLRNWHRDLGYFVVAVSLVYGISGILLTHRNIFPVIATIKTTDTFPAQLDIAGFSEQWGQNRPQFKLTKCMTNNNSINFYFEGGKGKYKMDNGIVSIETYKKHKLSAFLISLHANQKKGWKYIADFFAACLIFLAISGLFMVKGKNGFKKRGVWIMLAGMLVVITFLWIG